MTIALDIGAHSCRSLRHHDGELIGRSTRSAYLSIPDTGDQRELLTSAEVPFGTCEGHLILLGSAAVKWSRMLQVPYTPMLAGGTIPEGDALARQICGQLIESLLPPPATPGQSCTITVPTAVADRPLGRNREAEFIERVVRLRGYQPTFVRPAQAVLLAEAGQHSFTGLSLHMGASGCELTLGHCGKEIASLVLPMGGNGIDENIARDRRTVRWDSRGRRFLDLQQAARLREEYFGNGEDEFGKLLKRQLAQLVAMLLHRAAEQWSGDRRLTGFHRPLTLFCSGGLFASSLLPEIVRDSLQTARLPFTIRDLHFVDDAAYSVARGSLIAAELATESVPHRAVA